jgi:hypothetical protein
VKALLRKLIFAVVTLSMITVCAGVVVVSAAMALFGVLRDAIGQPGASGVVAGVALLLMVALGFVLEHWIMSKGAAGGGLAGLGGPRRHAGPEHEDETLLRRLIALAQGRPIVATGALISALVLAIRNPGVTAVVLKAFLDPKTKSAGRKS